MQSPRGAKPRPRRRPGPPTAGTDHALSLRHEGFDLRRRHLGFLRVGLALCRSHRAPLAQTLPQTQTQSQKGSRMSLDYALGGLLALALVGYLFYALVRPERF